MKKKLLTVLFGVMLVACIMLLSGCFLSGLFGDGGNGGDGGWDGKKVALSKDNFVYGFADGLRTYYYNGSPITVENDVMINTPDNRQRVPLNLFEFTYENNVNAGKATVTVTAKDDNQYYYGSVKFDFTIEKGVATVNSAEQLIAELNGDNVYQIDVIDRVNLEDAELTVKEGVTLNVKSTDQFNFVFELCGKLVNNGTINVQGSKYSSTAIKFVNDGEIVNNGTISVNGYTNVYNSGKLENNGEFTVNQNLSRIYTNEEIANVPDDPRFPSAQRIRQKISAENVKLGFTSTYFSENEADNKPTYLLQLDDRTRYVIHTYEYSNFDRAGTAYLDISVDRLDEWFYGNVTVEYEIKKGLANVNSVDELLTLQATGNYGGFYADDLTVAENETLTLEEGNKLTAYELRVLGKLVNNGEITVAVKAGSNSYVSGYLYVNYHNADSAGRLENNGTISALNFVLCKKGSVANFGEITVNGSAASLQATFENEQNAKLTVKNDFRLFGKLINKGTVNVAVGEYALIEKVEGAESGLINSGTLKIDGDVVCRSLDEFVNSGVIENSGTVWSYVELPSGFTNVVLKRQITHDDVILENSAPIYDGTGKPAILSQETGLKVGQYRVEYTYEGEDGGTSAAPVNAGKIKLFIQITDERTKYFAAKDRYDERGTLNDVPYEIQRAELAITSTQDLRDYCGNVNYSRLYLVNDITFPSANDKYKNSYFNIGKDVILDTNGYTLTLQHDSSISSSTPQIINYGTLYNSKVGVYGQNYQPTEADCGIILKNASINNYGKLINNNLIHLDRYSNLSNQNNSKIVNHGIMYLTADLPEHTEVENDGVIYERENLDDLDSDRTRFVLEYWEVDYNGEEHTPSITLFNRHGEAVEVTDGSRFTVNYTNRVSDRTCYVSVIANDAWDKEYYGHGFVNINVKKGVAKVSSFNALSKATQDSNYIGFELTESFMLYDGATIPAGTFLDLGLFSLRYNGSCKLNFAVGAELRVTVDSADRLLNYLYVADRLTLAADLTDESVMNVEFTTSAMGKLGQYSLFNKLYEGTTIDLNGHYVGGSLKLVNNYNPHINTTDYYVMNIVDTSVDKTGRLGSGAQYHGLDVTGNTPMYLKLNGVKVGGLALARTVYLTASNCEFATTAASGDARAAYYCGTTYNNNVKAEFEKCSFSGAVGAYLTIGHHLFRSCNVNANGSYVEGENGSAIIIKSNSAYAGIDGGNFHSDSGYCVEILNRLQVNYADIEITRRTNTDSGEGSDQNGRWSCGKSSKVNDSSQYAQVETLTNLRII